MKSVLLTGYDDAMRTIGDMTSPLMERYAETWHMDFQCCRDYPPERHPMWYKVELVIEAFHDGYDRILWLDADTIITNQFCSKVMHAGLHISRDWGEDASETDMSTCNFVAFKDTLPLWCLIASHHSNREFGQFHEQGAMRDFYKEHQWVRDMTTVYPRRVFNAVPQEVGPGIVEPWQKGDWLCHLTNIPNDRRVKLFKKITRRT